jgi:hypothetical protein
VRILGKYVNLLDFSKWAGWIRMVALATDRNNDLVHLVTHCRSNRKQTVHVIWFDSVFLFGDLMENKLDEKVVLPLV